MLCCCTHPAFQQAIFFAMKPARFREPSSIVTPSFTIAKHAFPPNVPYQAGLDRSLGQSSREDPSRYPPRTILTFPVSPMPWREWPPWPCQGPCLRNLPLSQFLQLPTLSRQPYPPHIFNGLSSVHHDGVGTAMRQPRHGALSTGSAM